MWTMGANRPDVQAGRLLELLEGLLAEDAIGLDDAMTRAAQRVAEALQADKVDVLLHDAATDALVAVGTSQTPMGRREHELGLDRLPIADGGWTVSVFQSGRSHLTRNADREPGEVTGLVKELGVRSSVNVPLVVGGERRGVLLASSATPDFFTEDDLVFVETVARWIGLAADRAAHVQCLVQAAAEQAAALAAEEAVRALTARQQEVAGLLTEGLTNEQIARRLVITPGTVANHVEHILRRLRLGSRVQVATWAARYGLGAPEDSGEGASPDT
jgi:DNA-binding CsgD family transcriptional regulator